MRSFRSFAPLALAAAAAGCSGPSASLSQCQSEKEQLLATIRDQREANRQMHDRVAALEARLDESEKELARAGQPAARLSKSAPAGNTNVTVGNALRGVPSTTRLVPSASGDAKLAWMSPGAASQPSSLAALAAKDNRVAIDRSQGVAHLNLPIKFADNSAALSAEAKQQLDDVARLLKSKEAADLKVLVSGFAEGRPPKTGEGAFGSARELAAARAQAVADYLDRHGIAEERLAVSGAGSRVSAEGGASRSAASGVQILVAERDAPLIGWGTSGTTLRR
jgi:outer membrane protein OmpA-like peptidoglycan-associated protein